MKHIAIIGNGISGVTAARHIRKLSDHKITLISAETEHFFSRTALMYVYMGHMKQEHVKPYEDHFWSKNRIDLKFGYVSKVDANNKKLVFDNQEELEFDDLIIACGSKPNKFGWKGQDLDGVQGLYSWQDLELMGKNSVNCERAVIVGGGLIGVEMAEMFLSRGIKVTFLVREKRFWGSVLPKEESELVSRHIISHHVDLRFETELEEIIPDENGRAKAIRTNDGEEIICQFVGLTAGVGPNVDFLNGGSVDLNRGVLVNEFLETNIPNVYSIGDCAEFHQHPTGRRNMEQVWYTGKMMGETVAQTICGTKTAYKPGIWFNSAKFFDIEYQTYGWVWAQPKENEAVLYWEHNDGKKCLKLIYDNNNGSFLAVNVFGIRLRHKVLDYWIKNETKIEEVLQNLEDANFEPQFYENSFPEIKKMFLLQLPKTV
ncbi:NAD(P)/FAD-dependent oxidoreductase [Vicingaceae bacterium]|nr:NAD(P)/FAD-dependent oxidoreductase [Vicingaceae bacterium]